MALLRETLTGIAATRFSRSAVDDDGDEEADDDASSGYPNVMGFEQLVTQRLLPPTFPRYSR